MLAVICRQANAPPFRLAGGCVPAPASPHLVTQPGGMLPTRSHGHQLCRAPPRKPKSSGAPGGHRQDHDTPEKMLPCPPQRTEQDALGSAKDNPAALHRSPTSLAPCLGTLWGHCAPFLQGNTTLAVPGTARAHRGGWQRPSERRRGGRAARGAFVYIVLLSQAALRLSSGIPWLLEGRVATLLSPTQVCTS